MKATISSEPKASENSEESSRRAAAADAADRPIEPEIVDEIPDPAAAAAAAEMHTVIVEVLRGTVIWANQSRGWEVLPNEEWHQSTGRLIEIVAEKWLGSLSTGPEVLLAFNLGVIWLLPNVLADIEKAKVKKAAEKKPPEDSRAAGA